jgi:hypothetical protein
MAQADWSRDRAYESAVNRFHDENAEDLRRLAGDLKDSSLVPLYRNLIDNSRKAAEELVEKAE